MKDQRRVVFTGHSGIAKSDAIVRLSECIFSKDERWVELAANPKLENERRSREAQLVQIIDAGEFKENTTQFRGEFLFTHNPVLRYDTWAGSVSSSVSQGDAAENIFLMFNASFYSRSQFFSPLCWYFPTKPDVWSLFAKFQPTQFVNLYDNIYFARDRIKEDYNFSLAELLHWRNIELLTTDLLATRFIPQDARTRVREVFRRNSVSVEYLDVFYPFERSMYFAVGHPTSTLFNLLFMEDMFRIYLSFPISEPRKQLEENPPIGEKLMGQIDHFRTAMSDYFVAFDPLTIDEKPLEFAQRALPTGTQVTLDTRIASKKIWPNIYPNALNGPQLEKEIVFDWEDIRYVAVQKPAGKVGSDLTGSEIDHQVASRDFRLIDQSDGMIVFRPGFNKTVWDIGGTRAELQYAQQAYRRKPVIVIHDLADGDLNKPPLNYEVDETNIVKFPDANALDNEAKRAAAFEMAKERMHQRLKEYRWFRNF